MLPMFKQPRPGHVGRVRQQGKTFSRPPDQRHSALTMWASTNYRPCTTCIIGGGGGRRKGKVARAVPSGLYWSKDLWTYFCIPGDLAMFIVPMFIRDVRNIYIPLLFILYHKVLEVHLTLYIKQTSCKCAIYPCLSSVYLTIRTQFPMASCTLSCLKWFSNPYISQSELILTGTKLFGQLRSDRKPTGARSSGLVHPLN